MTLPDPAAAPPPLTVAVPTKNRPEALARCLRSLRLLEGLVDGAVVVDDGSDPPAEGPALALLAADLPPRVRWLRHERSLGASACRNRAAAEAGTPLLLYLDDDAFVVSREAVERAVAVLEGDPGVAAVALAQGDEEGVRFPASMQPAPVEYPCYVPTFTGYGFVVRREALLAAGGFRERLEIHGEEKELSLRLLDRGLRVVYLPGAVVGHVAAAAGRDPRRYLHQTVRNNTLGALYNEPFPLVLAGAGMRLYSYFAMRRGWKVHDPGGFGAIVRGLARDLPAVLRERRPVRWATWKRWRRMKQSPPEPYEPPAPGVTAGAGEG
ncbi:MAG: glycosyltransferase family 2 protein [Longimicrobiaceae bacterium]